MDTQVDDASDTVAVAVAQLCAGGVLTLIGGVPEVVPLISIARSWNAAKVLFEVSGDGGLIAKTIPGFESGLGMETKQSGECHDTNLVHSDRSVHNEPRWGLYR